MIEPASEEGGGREDAALSNALRKRRDGAVDSAMTRVEAAKTNGALGMRAVTSGEEAKTGTLEYLKQWTGWGRSFWFQTQSRNLPTYFFSFGGFAALAKAFAGNESGQNPHGCKLNSGRSTLPEIF